MAIFAKYDGIDGEATDAHHHRWVDILSLDWGAQRADAGATGQGRRRGSAVVEDMVLAFEYEKAAPKLLDRCLKGAVVPKLDIELTATSGGARVTYLKYELKKVMVTSYRVSASGDDGAGPPTVIVANDFEELKVTYTEFDDTGAMVGNVETVYKRDSRSRRDSAAVKAAAKKAGSQKRGKTK
jgi:type VI secretion system Hcp family effector